MALFYSTTNQAGTADDDYMFGHPGWGPNHTFNGNGGDDVIYGDFDSFDSFPTTTFQTATSLTNYTSPWSTYENAEVLNATTVPHMTAYVNAAPGTTVWYAVTVAAGATITLDVDFGYGTTGGGSTDSKLAIVAGDGTTILAQNDDAFGNPADLPGQLFFDSYMQYTFAAAGTYYINVSKIGGTGTFQGGEEFLLNVSLTGQTVTNGDPVTGNDFLTGDDGNDFIDGGGGDDQIFGGANNDVLIGGSGVDTIFGGSGTDTICITGSGAGRDVIDGGTEADTLDLSRMTQFAWVNLAYSGDEVQTQDGTVWRRLADMAGVENVTGTNFNDQIFGDGQGNLFRGGNGSDTIYGRAGEDDLGGDGGNDYLYGESGNDSFNSDDGADYMSGGSEGDTFNFKFGLGVGLDTVDGGSGVDTINCGAFQNIAWVDLATAGYELYTKNGASWVGIANVSNVENVIGSANNDEFYGDAANNRFEGGLGQDKLDGRGGVDTLDGGAGNDTIIGGDLADTLNGGTGNDTFVFASNLTGLDTVDGGADSDTADCSAFTTKAWVDLQYTGAEIYTISGGVWKAIANTTSVENAIGTAVADELYGNGARNILNGGGGNDIIAGRGGYDVLTGGTGSDTFKFSPGDSMLSYIDFDVITDFAKGAVGVGDEIDFVPALSIGFYTGEATSFVASINQATGVATFAPGSGTTMSDALSDLVLGITDRRTAGAFALFQVNNTGPMYMLVSDGEILGAPNDVLITLNGITSVNSINLTGGDLTILT